MEDVLVALGKQFLSMNSLSWHCSKKNYLKNHKGQSSFLHHEVSQNI